MEIYSNKWMNQSLAYELNFLGLLKSLSYDVNLIIKNDTIRLFIIALILNKIIINS